MTLTEVELDEIGADLIAGVGRHNKRRRRHLAMAAVPVLGILAGAAVVVAGGDDTPAYALTERPEGIIEVEIFPDFDDAEALASELTDAGLSVEVVHLRAHPSLDGVAEVVSHDNEGTEALEFAGSEFRIDVGEADGLIEILLYTAAEPGDDYQASPSLFAPGQPLAGMNCAYGDLPMPTEDLEDALKKAGYEDSEWTVFGDSAPETGVIDTEDHDDRPEGFVAGASLRNETTMFVAVVEEANPAESIIMDDGTHYRERPQCTAELAAPWE